MYFSCVWQHGGALMHIPPLDFHLFLNICRNDSVLYKDRGGDSIYYNLLEPQGLTTSYFILMFLHSQAPILFLSRRSQENFRGEKQQWQSR